MSADTTTSTIVDVGRPPATIPEHTWKGENVPHRDLPHTGTASLLLPSAGLVLSVGLLLTVWARRARQKRTQRYVAAKGISTPELDVWVVLDTKYGNNVHSEWRTRDAARNRAQVLNANLTPLSERET